MLYVYDRTSSGGVTLRKHKKVANTKPAVCGGCEAPQTSLITTDTKEQTRLCCIQSAPEEYCKNVDKRGGDLC